MKFNRKLVLVLALVLSVAMATTGTLAYLTDRDSAANVFTMGNLTIELNEGDFDNNNDNVLLPGGPQISKKPSVKNTSSNVEAYVWIELAVPTGAMCQTVDSDANSPYGGAIHFGFLGAEGSDWHEYKDVRKTGADAVEINGKLCDVYTFLFNDRLLPGCETDVLFHSVYMDASVDITPEGDVYSVVNGVATSLQYNINDGELPVYVSAYAIQATDGNDMWESVAAAYDIYHNQWGTNGTEWGTTTFKPSDSLNEEDGVVTISSASDLLAFANAVNSGNYFSGKTVKLTADIDLKNTDWTPIGRVIVGGNSVGSDNNKYFQGTFDGQGHTIKNLYVNNKDEGGYASTGLFGWIDAAGATIKNVTIDGANVTGHHYTGALVGYMSGTIENCHVKNATVNSTHANDNDCGDKAGAVVGYLNANAKAINCSAEDSEVKAGRDAGQVVGSCYNNTNTVSGCWATNVTVESNGTCTDANAGANIKNATVGRPNGATVNNATTISTKADLKAFADQINTGAFYYNETVVLTADIDLNDEPWTPIRWQGNDGFSGTFDGNGHTIRNLNINDSTGEYYACGLFGYTDNYMKAPTVKNLTVDGAKVTGTQYVGVIFGYFTGTMENCHVKNAVVTCNHVGDKCGDKAGAVIGYMNAASSMTNCSATKCEVAGARDVGQLVGAALVVNNNVVSNCTATNVTVSATTGCTNGSSGTNIKNELVGRQ